jgi:hypothetical protein
LLTEFLAEVTIFSLNSFSVISMQNSLPTVPTSRVGRYSDLLFTGLPRPVEKLSTDWSDVENFIESAGGEVKSGFTRWMTRNRERRSDFDKWHGVYRNFRHETLFTLKPDEITAHVRRLASLRGEHALGTLKGRDQTSLIKNVTPTAPIMLSFHTVLELYRRPFLWTEFWNFHLENEDYFLRHALDAIGISARAKDVDFEGSLHLRTIRYRLGMGFYTGWKEAFVLSVLRHVHGLDVRYHFFLDLEWKADLYAGDLLVEIFLNNEIMKAVENINGRLTSEMTGRKTPCADRNPGKKVLVVAKDAENRFGSCWLHERSEVDWMASRLLAYGCPLIAGLSRPVH